MTILNIITFPNKNLLNKANPVFKITKEIKDIINNMIETMIYHKGLGLAATQVKIKKRIIVINISNKKSSPLIIINPKILFYSKKIIISKEGCLSFPNIYVNIKRKNNIKIKFSDIKKKIHTLHANKLLSICIQHEIDHLNGITLYDSLSPLKKKLLFKNFTWTE